MCSASTFWSATEAIHNFSHAELRKLGVIIEMPLDSFNFTQVIDSSSHFQPSCVSDWLNDVTHVTHVTDVTRATRVADVTEYPRPSTILATSYTLRPWLRLPRPM